MKKNEINVVAFEASKECSTLRMVTNQKPVIKNYKTDKVHFRLIMPSSKFRIAEGGIRTKGYYKFSKPNIPLISAITIVFNGEKYIENTILSVLKQSYDNVEYIIIDGGSADGTLDIIKKYDSQIDYWISEEDKGIVDAFNKGISLCTGDIIGIINADDWYSVDAFEKVAQCKKQPAVICGNVQYWDEYKKNYIYTTNISGLPREMTVNHPAVFVNKNIYKEFGSFDQNYKYAMDYEMLLRFYKKGIKFVEIDSVLANMRLGGISDANWTNSFNEVRLAKIQHGESYLFAFFYYIKQITRKKFAYLLSSMGLELVVKVYRDKFSIMKKYKS